MAAASRRELFLQVGGNVDQLATAMRAGRSVINEFGASANATVGEIEKAFQRLGGGTIEQNAKSLESAYVKSFDNIRRNARSVVDAPSGSAALTIVNAAAAEQAAAAAENQAVALRMVAAAAARAADATTGDSAAARVYAASAEAAAVGAEHYATSLRSQATTLGTIETELRATGAAHVAMNDNMTHSAGQQRQGMMQLGEQFRQFATEVQLGISPVQAFAQQSGQAAFALQFLGGKAGAIGTFLASGWGTLVLVATTAVLTFAAETLKAGSAIDEATDKLKKDAEETEIARQAKERFALTEQGVAAAIREQADAFDKAIKAERSAAEQANITAKANLDKEIAIRRATAAQLEAAIAQEQADRTRSGGPGQRGELGTLADTESSGRVAGLQDALAKNNASVERAQKNLSESRIGLAVDEATRMADPIERIKKLYDDRIKLVKDSAREEGNLSISQANAVARRIADLQRQRDVEVKAQQDRQRESRTSDRQSGRTVDLSQARSIVEGIGGVVTSGARTRAQQQEAYDRYKAGTGPLAAVPGTSYHESGQALDIRKTAGMTLGRIVKAFEDQGVKLVEKLDEGDHFHVAWGKKGKSQETIDRQVEAADQKRIRDAEAFAQMKGRAQEEQLQLMRAQVTDIAAAADLDAKAVEVERQRLNSAAQVGVAEKRWSQAKANELITLNNSNAASKTTTVRQKEQHDLLDQQLNIDRTGLQDKASLLSIQSRVALTRRAQLDLDLQLLAIQEEIVRREARKVLADPTASAVDKTLAQGRIDAVDAEHPGNVAAIRQQRQDPVEAYRSSLVRNVGDMNDAMKGVEADGLRGLEDGLVGIVSGTETVASAFKKMASAIISDLARIAVQRLIIAPLADSLFGKSDGSGGGALSSLSSFFGGLGKHADGGHIIGPGTGRSDSILSFLSNGEFVVNAAATSRNLPLLHAINDNAMPRFADGGLVGSSKIFMPAVPSAASMSRPSATQTPLYFDLRNAVMTEDLLRQMQTISAEHATQAVIGGSQMAQNDLAERQMQQIPA